MTQKTKKTKTYINNFRHTSSIFNCATASIEGQPTQLGFMLIALDLPIHIDGFTSQERLIDLATFFKELADTLEEEASKDVYNDA